MEAKSPIEQGMTVCKKIASFLMLIMVMMVLGAGNASAQTKGIIYKSAEGDGRLILDPNGDGYVSSTTSGFSSNDESESEISFFGMPVLTAEPLSDVRTGASGGHTDLATTSSTTPAAYMYYDGTNLLFRVRIADQSTASKGYSFFFNTDFDVFGPKASGFTSSNPGFQFEIVLETGKGVSIYTLNGDNATLYKRLTEADHFQKSLSYTLTDGSTGHFYDFYVPVSEIQGAVSGFTVSTGFRAAMATITRAQSGITGTLSDINGVNDDNYKNATQALVDIVEAAPSTNLNDIGSGGGGFGASVTDVPSIDIPLVDGDTEVSGTSIEADGTTITVYVGGSSVGTATVSSNTWTTTVTALSAGDIVTASADATGKDASAQSDGITVLAANQQCTDDPINVAQGGNTLSGTITGLPTGLSNSHLTSNVIIRVYRGGNVFVSTSSSDPGTDGYVGYNSFAYNSSTGNYDFELDNGQSGKTGPGGESLQ
ncbi:MAG: hypothetical protein FH748_11870 [Balneolaceae bacterium]|nr:hypothetical protein [Balneolaceae bacterium]